MKGTILDFLELARRNEELGREIIALAAKHDFEFTQEEELSEEELGAVSGGTTMTWSPSIFYIPLAPTTPAGPQEEDPLEPGEITNPFKGINMPPPPEG